MHNDTTRSETLILDEQRGGEHSRTVQSAGFEYLRCKVPLFNH